MSTPLDGRQALKHLENEILAEGQEWMRRRLAQRLAAQAEAASAVSPLRQRQRRSLTLHTVVGAVTVSVVYGRDPRSGKWGCPARAYWGLGPHQKMTPELEDRVCLTATLTGSYQAAAALTAKWGSPVDAATIRVHARQLGQRAEAQAQQRLATPAGAVATMAKPAGLVIMMDGWMARQRGADWGAEPGLTGAAGWPGTKSREQLIYRLEQAGQTAGGRGVITEKWAVAWQGEPLEFGRRVYAEALRRGLGSAREVFVVADGGVWIWRVQQDRFPEAQGVLDFYHASQHLWAVGQALYPADAVAARTWVEPLLSQLRHGQEAGVLQTLTDLPAWCAEQAQAVPAVVARETEYFQNHREHVHYQAREAQGCPVGSGAMESFCAQLQGRFKRCGQFWSSDGMADLLALDIARRNLDWDALWTKN